MKPTIYLGGDHAAFELKEKIVAYLKTRGYTVRDFGPHQYDPDDDYPDFVIPAARAVAKHKNAFGITVCGSGIGECIAVNKIKSIRAALVYDLYTARMSRKDNNANILCLGGRTTGKNFALIKKILATWLTTPFSNAPRHVRRLKKIDKIERG